MLLNVDRTCRIITNPIKYRANFSFNSFIRPMKIIIEPETAPETDNARMNHLSGLDAWRIKLSAQANRKKTNSTIQADIQYLVTKCLMIIVKHMPDVVHS